MLEFEEYKVKLNNLKPELEELYTSLGLEQAKREVEELEIKSSQPGFWDNPEESQKIVSRMGSLKGKVEAYNKMTELCDDLLTICEMAIEENDESMLEELESGYKELEDGIAAAEEIGYPVLVRPSFVLGGRAMQIVANEDQLRHYLRTAVEIDEDKPVLVDKYIQGREVEIDAICDGRNGG